MSHCLLTAETLLTESQRWIVTGGTDGALRLWLSDITQDSSSISQELGVLQPHMSGINALDVIALQMSSNLWLVASGGDDNSIHLSVFQYQNFTFNVLHEHHTDKAHATQITGLKLLHPQKSEAGIVHLISSSIDQRVTRWVVCLKETLSMTLAESFLTSIADVSALEVWADKDALCWAVCGHGIQVVDRCFSNT